MPGELKRSRRFQFDAGSLLHFGAEPIYAAFGKNVLEPRMLAIGTVAPVALHGDDRFRDRECVLAATKAHHVGGAGEGVRLAVGHAHAAADRDVPAADRALAI